MVKWQQHAPLVCKTHTHTLGLGHNSARTFLSSTLNIEQMVPTRVFSYFWNNLVPLVEVVSCVVCCVSYQFMSCPKSEYWHISVMGLSSPPPVTSSRYHCVSMLTSIRYCEASSLCDFHSVSFSSMERKPAFLKLLSRLYLLHHDTSKPAYVHVSKQQYANRMCFSQQH